MKKKILGLCTAVCLGVTLTGCSATADDLENQLEKMEAIIEEGDIYEDDWALSAEYEGQDVTVKKDGDNFYMDMNMDGNVGEVWMIKDGAKYTVYGKMDGKKYKAEVDTEEVEAMLAEFDIKEYHEGFFEILKAVPEACEEEGVTCEFEKNLFGKFTASMEVDDTGLTFVIKGGKLLSLSGNVYGTEMSIEFDYGNQRVKAPADADEYIETEE